MTDHDINDGDQLRALFREPSERVKAKKGSVISGATERFLSRSPFFTLATADADGSCDVSPRGGPPGQIKVLDGGRAVAFPDLTGNNLIDSLSNIVANPSVGLLVMVPGSDETLRIDGPARITTDPEILGLWREELRQPKLVVVVEVGSVFMHCAKAFRRSALWDPETWPTTDDTDAPEMFNDITGTDMEPAVMREFLEADYRESLESEQP